MSKRIRNILIVVLIINSITESYAQLDGRFGVTAGITNYMTDTDFLFSKSSIGYSLGITGTTIFSEKLELFLEMNYTKNMVYLVGRESELAPPEDIKFKLENINIPLVLDYTVLNLNDEWYFGLNTGVSASLIYEYNLVDESKENYILEPLYTNPYYLKFDTNNEKISFNAFLIMGVSVEYLQVLLNLRYYRGLSDPYRNAPVYSTVMDITGRDSYFALSFTYLFDEKYY